MKLKLASACLMLQLLLVMVNKSASAQNRMDVNVGAGMPELINIGGRLTISQFQFGADIGVWPTTDKNYFTFSGDIYYHLLGQAKYGERKPWYVRVNGTYLRMANTDLTLHYIYIQHRFGRAFNFTEKLGASADLGFGYQVFYKEVNNSSDRFYGSDVYVPLIPSFGINMFYRIK